MKDINDSNTFRHHRARGLGHLVGEFNQPTPFFFTREMNAIPIVGNYRGASIFLVCNGPSLVTGGYDLSLMKSPGIVTYGVNNGPKTFRPNFWSCVDDPSRFMMNIWQDPSICKIVPHAHAEKVIFDNEKWDNKKIEKNGKLMDKKVGDCPNVIYFHRNERFIPEQFLFEDTINWGNHKNYGGCRSVMLATLKIIYLLGFRNVYIIGADFNMSENYTYHFEEERTKGAVSNNMSSYNRMETEYFPSLIPYFKEAGYSVYNCTKGSKLTAFPYVDYEEAIQKVIGETGDANSRTKGLYAAKSDGAKRNENKAINKIVKNDISGKIKSLQENNLGTKTSRNVQNFAPPVSPTSNTQSAIKKTVTIDNTTNKFFIKSMSIANAVEIIRTILNNRNKGEQK